MQNYLSLRAPRKAGGEAIFVELLEIAARHASLAAKG